MSRDDDVVVSEIKTPITFVVNDVSEKNTSSGLGRQFVSSISGKIRITGTTERAQVLIGGGDFMEDEVWTGGVDHLSGEVVQQICGGVESFYPVASGIEPLKTRNAAYY
jgi:hypothetical protein